MRLEPGMRVRCVDAIRARYLTQGREYLVCSADKTFAYVRDDRNESAHSYFANRFKPVVRVKAPSRRVHSDGCCHRTVMVRCRGCPYA